MKSQEKFGELLRSGIDHICARQSISKRAARKILADATSRSSGTVEKWQQGKHLPTTYEDLENLVNALVKHANLESAWVREFVFAWGGDERDVDRLCAEIFEQETTLYMPLSLHPFSTAFVDGPPISHPRQFFGHHTLMQRTLNLLDPEISQIQSPRIIGAKRSGKTSFLKYLYLLHNAPVSELTSEQMRQRRTHLTKFRWIYIDFQHSLYQELHFVQHAILEAIGCLTKARDLGHFTRLFMDNMGEPTILMLDELEVTYTKDEFEPFWGGLRSLVSHNHQLGIIIATQDSLSEQADHYGKPSPFFNIFVEYLLEPLTIDAAEALIGSSPLEFDSADSQWIIEKSRRWPALLQCLCRIRLEALQIGEPEDEWKIRGNRALQSSKYRYLL